jgi:predicted transcriptional regulator
MRRTAERSTLSRMRGPDSAIWGRVLERFITRFARGRREPDAGLLESCFGPLEIEVLEILWQRGADASVRDLRDQFPETAYTTLMTTLDRLYKKGALERRKSGRAYLYRPRCGRPELESRLARDAFDLLFAGRMRGARARPVLSGLVDAVGADDERLLDELERIVRERRADRTRMRARRGRTE